MPIPGAPSRSHQGGVHGHTCHAHSVCGQNQPHFRQARPHRHCNIAPAVLRARVPQGYVCVCVHSGLWVCSSACAFITDSCHMIALIRIWAVPRRRDQISPVHVAKRHRGGMCECVCVMRESYNNHCTLTYTGAAWARTTRVLDIQSGSRWCN
jgi:hypothetical protein